MIKLNSFSDLEVPAGLFPDESNFILDNLAIRSTNLLAGLSIENINEALIEARKSLRTWGHINYFIAFNNSYYENKSNKTFRFVPPETEIINQNLSLEAFSGTTSSDKEQMLSGEISKNITIAKALQKDKKTQGAITLYYYLLAIKVAQQINRHNRSENNSYYRLGKVSRYLYSAEFALSMMDLVDREIIAITHKEKQVREKTQKTASKGGKNRVHKYSVLKEKVFNLYDEKHSGRSNRDAAIRICKELGRSGLSILTTSYPEETVAKWIGQYKKKKEG